MGGRKAIVLGEGSRQLALVQHSRASLYFLGYKAIDGNWRRIAMDTHAHSRAAGYPRSGVEGRARQERERWLGL